MTALFLVSLPASGGPISLGTWYEFGFDTFVSTTATGCDPADPAGAFCTPSAGTPTTFLDAPPWTFTAPGVGAILTVVDAFTNDDRFEVFDLGGSLGLTSAPGAPADCGDDPVPCLADPNMSRGSFGLAAGNHSITIEVTQGTLGSGYLRVDAVPEPASGLLLISGAVVLGLAGRWRSRSGRPAR
jgi:hypothetical protein